ncbi:hypothetical protein FXN63_04505 [Pigmentiphaga aceris]|uniref:Uncharacterized protein n=1 Tax=Pigmentiphaga aceris TaxID=1940612 RepID=A0A5C0ASI4_9BURK|nr:hypothetical protein [Pigmentiphaga aceris]QEI05178.1 hypothetical protein FXN63_04505 [Pigmentiphaga aceris]
MRRVATACGLFLLLLSVVLLVTAINTPRYTDAAAFRQGVDALAAIEARESTAHAAAMQKDLQSMTKDEDQKLRLRMQATYDDLEKKYHGLLDTYESNKSKLLDYGGTALVMALVLLMAGVFSRTPSRRVQLHLCLFAAALLTFGAFVFGFWLWLAREQISPWGALPAPYLVLGVLGFGLVPAIWAAGHLLLVPEVYYQRQPLWLALSRRVHPWLGLMSVLFALATVLSLFFGFWWWTITFLVWTYAYMSMAASHRACHLFADQEPEWPPAWNT